MADPFFQKYAPVGQPQQQPTQPQQPVQQNAPVQNNQQQAQQQTYTWEQLAYWYQQQGYSPQQIQMFYQQYMQQQQAAHQQQTYYNQQQMVVDKKGSKLSLRGFLIGCVLLLLVFMGISVAILYYLIQNPDQLANMGLNRDTLKLFLQTFAVIFFGLLFFVGFAMITVYGYRLITVKNRSKVGYFFGMILGLVILGFSIGAGAVVIRQIDEITSNGVIDARDLLVPQLAVKGGYIYAYSDNTSLIAPGIVTYQLDAELFNAQIMPQLGLVDINTIDLDCGNGTVLPINMQSASFQGSCMYTTKGSYDLTLRVTATNRSDGIQNITEISAGAINFVSEVSLSLDQGNVVVNDASNELIVGKVPRKVSFDATNVFRDFGLTDYVLNWDVDGDGRWDRQNDVTFTNVFKQARVFEVGVQFPELSDAVYIFPLRVEQSEVPVCEITASPIQGSEYAFSVSFIDRPAQISEYGFSLIDKKQNNQIDSVKTDKNQFVYTFPGAGRYAVKLDFVTDEGKKGSCESEDIQVGRSDFDITYEIQYKSPQAPQFKKLDRTNPDTKVYMSGNQLVVSELPTVIQLNIQRIIPNSNSAETIVWFDGKPILSRDNQTFEMTIDTNTKHTISIVVQDQARNARSEEVIDVSVKKDDIIGILDVKPDRVGIDPFKVEFDASKSYVNDTQDEIVYFTWDFGDGEKKVNSSEAKISHTYRYDYAKERGSFNPTVLLVTRKNRQLMVGLDSPLLVKKPIRALTIRAISHPTQVANIGDRIDLSLDEVDGLPSLVQWDFGDGNTLECKGRDCLQTQKVYETEGDYTIRVRISYTDQPGMEGILKMRIK